jgi:hypothetical protein
MRRDVMEGAIMVSVAAKNARYLLAHKHCVVCIACFWTDVYLNMFSACLGLKEHTVISTILLRTTDALS